MFVARFLQHVLPPGFKRIRHYGLLSPAAKSTRLAQARAAFLMPAIDAPACDHAAQFLKRTAGIDALCCIYCRLRHWHTVQALPPRRDASVPLLTSCRGPP
jgi:hypothetical protein